MIEDFNILESKYGKEKLVKEMNEYIKMVQSTEQKDLWDKMAPVYDLNPSDFGKKFISGKSSFRISGIKPTNRKYPVLAERVSDGKTYKFPVESVKILLGR